MLANANLVTPATNVTNARLDIVNFQIACHVLAIPEGFYHLTIARVTVCARRTLLVNSAIIANQDILL